MLCTDHELKISNIATKIKVFFRFLRMLYYTNNRLPSVGISNSPSSVVSKGKGVSKFSQEPFVLRVAEIASRRMLSVVLRKREI